MTDEEKLNFQLLVQQFRYLLEEANFALAKEKTKNELLKIELEKSEGNVQKAFNEVVRIQDELMQYKSKFGDINEVEKD